MKNWIISLTSCMRLMIMLNNWILVEKKIDKLKEKIKNEN